MNITDVPNVYKFVSQRRTGRGDIENNGRAKSRRSPPGRCEVSDRDGHVRLETG